MSRCAFAPRSPADAREELLELAARAEHPEDARVRRLAAATAQARADGLVERLEAAAARALAGSVGAPPAVDEQAVRAAIQGALTDAGVPVAVGAVEVDASHPDAHGPAREAGAGAGYAAFAQSSP